MVSQSIDFCLLNMCKATFFDNATHWVQHDEPEKVAQVVSTFLQA